MISEHKQVRNALYNFGEKKVKSDLVKLSALRKKADYEPFKDISPDEVNEASEPTLDDLLDWPPVFE